MSIIDIVCILLVFASCYCAYKDNYKLAIYIMLTIIILCIAKKYTGNMVEGADFEAIQNISSLYNDNKIIVDTLEVGTIKPKSGGNSIKIGSHTLDIGENGLELDTDLSVNRLSVADKQSGGVKIGDDVHLVSNDPKTGGTSLVIKAKHRPNDDELKNVVEFTKSDDANSGAVFFNKHLHAGLDLHNSKSCIKSNGAWECRGRD